MSTPFIVPGNWQLPDAIRQRLGTSVGRQRTMQADGHLLLVVHEVPVAGEVNRRGLLFWRDPEGKWRCSNGKPGDIEIKNLLQRYSDRLEEFDKLEHAAERADEYSQLLEGLSPVVRAARNLLEVMEDARKAVPADRGVIDYRDRAYEVSRTAELLYDDSKNSMDVAVVKRAEEQARASQKMLVTAHRLNVLAALFFPFATLGAVFGTTLTDNWSWSQSPLPFALFLGGSAIVGVILALFIARDESIGKK